MDSDDEAYILLLLADGNLPTGSFVASAGLESFVTHGFLTPSGGVGSTQNDKVEHAVGFIRDSLSSYARSALPFVADSHLAVEQLISSASSTPGDHVADVVQSLHALDNLYDTTTLNHIARRASQTQGVALLSLYSKGFTRPAVHRRDDIPSPNVDGDTFASTLIDRLKLDVRREDTPGHLPICWGLLTAALGLSLERSQFLHLFLYARGVLSAGVRMNVIGPYASQQLLLHIIRPLVAAEAAKCGKLRTGITPAVNGMPQFDGATLNENGPAMTWPLGEILGARHDLQHSRIFNS